MLRSLICLVFILTFSGCKLFHKKRTVFFEGGGTYTDVIDSNLKKDVVIVHFNHSAGVIFPAAYAKERFGSKHGFEDTTFFTPDSNLIRRVDEEVNYQYCTAIYSYNVHFVDKFITKVKAHTVEPKLTTAQEKINNEISMCSCLSWQKNFEYYDQQYIGYVTPNGEKIINIKLLDFRRDPQNMKQFFAVSWIDGWHGWFYSNIKEMHFDVKKNLLIVDNDE